MAIYHLSVKAVSRSAGRTATAAAAYRAGCEITDERTGEIHDYTRKGGVESADIVLPDGAPDWATDRAKLWNAAELAEKRKDACVAREFEVALPSELSPAERRRLALDFAKDMANREGCAVDVAIHAPGRDGDNRNHHAHILRTTRKVEADGLGAKLDTEKAGRKRSDDLEAVRAKWADLTNERLREHGIAARVDHRSLEAQGIERKATKHLGPTATGFERRTGEQSNKRQEWEHDSGGGAVMLTLAKEAEEQERRTAQEQSRQRIEAIPIRDLEKAWDQTVSDLATKRGYRLQRVSEKAKERLARRQKVAEEKKWSAPKRPTGMFAFLKQKAYERELAKRQIEWQKAVQLVESAKLLRTKISGAMSDLTTWAYGVAKENAPDAARRVEEHRARERLEKSQSKELRDSVKQAPEKLKKQGGPDRG